MKLGLLFSGGKDSMLAGFIADKYGHDLSCLISILSENKNSFMFHTPSVSNVEVQAEALEVPILIKKTKGEKEIELDDLKNIINRAKSEYGIKGIITGAVLSVYQASRIQRICNELELEVFNPLWQKNQEEILKELIDNNFDVRVVGVFAYPLTKIWLGRPVDKNYIDEVKKLSEKFGISIAGEGGEFESFVLDCPLFKKKIKMIEFEDSCDGENSCRRELKLRVIENE